MSSNADERPPLILKIENYLSANELSPLIHLTEKSLITCVYADSKFILIGTSVGSLYVLDFVGNPVNYFEFKCSPITSIHMEESSEKMVLCCGEAKVIISGVTEKNAVSIMNLPGIAKYARMGLNYSRKSNSDKYVIVAMREKLAIIEHTWLGHQVNILHQSFFDITSVALNSEFVAWSDDVGVNILCLKTKKKLGISFVPEDQNQNEEQRFECGTFLSWIDTHTFIVARRRTIQVQKISMSVEPKPGNASQISSPHSLSQMKIDLVFHFQTEQIIRGCSWFSDNIVYMCIPYVDEEQHLNLINNSERMTTAKSEEYSEDSTISSKDLDSSQQKIILHVHSYTSGLSNAQRCTIAYSLNLNFIHENLTKAMDYFKDPERELLIRCCDDQSFFLHLPGQFLMIQPRSENDQILWLIKKSQYEAAIKHSESKSGDSCIYRVKKVRELCLKDIISKWATYESSNDLRWISSLLSSEVNLWNEFASHAISSSSIDRVIEFLPLDASSEHNVSLSSDINSKILLYYLRKDCNKFYKILKGLPSGMYDDEIILSEVETITSSVSSAQANDILLQAQALIYSHKKLFQKGIQFYLRLKNPDVFDLIEKECLFDEVKHHVQVLLEIDSKRAIQLFVSHPSVIAPEQIVTEIRPNDSLLLEYLLQLHNSSPVACQSYEDLMVEIMAKRKDSRLLQFLKESSGYNMKTATHLCRVSEMFLELSFLHERTGDIKSALKVLVAKMEDIPAAIALCRKHNRLEMWDILIDKCLIQPRLLRSLFAHIGTYIDPLSFLKKIPCDMYIPDLKNSLVQILRNCSANVDLTESSLTIMNSDCISLVQRLITNHPRGSFIQDYFTDCCSICGDLLTPIQKNSVNTAKSLCLYQCGHSTHSICSKQEKSNVCRICYQLQEVV